MSRPWLGAWLALVLLSTASASDVCASRDWPSSPDLEISCSRSRDELELRITCLSSQPWSTRLSKPAAGNLAHRVNATLRDCHFPRGFNLLERVTAPLGLHDVQVLKLENATGLVDRELLRGLEATTLLVQADGELQVAADALHDARFQELLMIGLGVTDLPAGMFEPAANLTYLEISESKLQRLKRRDLDGLVNLEKLLLYSNELEAIEAGSFDNLRQLQVLDISNNRLRSLSNDLFKRLVNLRRLRVSQNEFDDLPGDLLHLPGSRLDRFRMSHNRGALDSLPAGGFFRELKNLTYLELTSNGFASLPGDLLLGAPALEALNVSNNSLAQLPAGLFDATRRLKELWMSENLLEALPAGLFDETSELRVLYLDYNKLAELTPDVLSGLTSLETLQASHNQLANFFIAPDGCKRYLNLVQAVDLSHNRLTLDNPHMDSYSVFVNCVNIRDLNVSHNNVSQIFRDFAFFGPLRSLNMENNSITAINAQNIDELNHNVELNLKNNRITTIDLSGLEDIAADYRAKNEEPKNARIELNNNPLHCDCRLIDLVRYLEHKLNKTVYTYVKLHAGELKCASPPEFEGLSLRDIYPDELGCPRRTSAPDDACNASCACWEFPARSTLSVDCSYRRLTELPARVANPQNWSIELNMTGNLLRSTPALNRSYLLNVTALDLSSNNVSNVGLEVFSPSLRELHLHNNSIARLDARVVEHLNEDRLLRNLTLHRNRWICDCEARNFLNAVQKKLTIQELQEVMCHGSGRRLSQMTVNELCEGAVAIIVAVSLLVAFFSIVLGALAALYYRYQKEIKVWLYSKQWCLWFVTEDELDRDKQYDAFISYSHKDEDFVDKEIVAKLEAGARPYKLCLHYRDWLAGEWIPAQIARSVDESRRTIVVLSPNFIESVWGRMEFRTAHSQALSEGRARVIVILYGDIGNTEDLDPELKAYLSMNTYVKWGDPWFWDKLRYALPHRQEASRRRTRNARIIENHLSQLPMNNHHHEDSGKAEIIPMPKIVASTNDSAKLLDSGAEDDRNMSTC